MYLKKMTKDINKWWTEEQTLVTNKHMEIHIDPNSDREMEIQSAMKSLFTPTSWAKIVSS